MAVFRIVVQACLVLLIIVQVSSTLNEPTGSYDPTTAKSETNSQTELKGSSIDSVELASSPNKSENLQSDQNSKRHMPIRKSPLRGFQMLKPKPKPVPTPKPTPKQTPKPKAVNIVTKVMRKKLEKARMVMDPQFDYIISNDNICDSETNIFIWVHTAPSQVRKRLTLRNTWANPSSFPPGYRAKMGFFIGAISHKNETIKQISQDIINFENEAYGDIIQENYIDNYHNISYKAISAVKWITKHCPQAKLVIKTDDDTLADVPLLLRHITSLQSQGQMLDNTVMCKIYHGARVSRVGKWKILISEFDKPRFPDYCQGLAVVMTGDVIPQLYEQSRKLTPLWVDDAWMFGIVINQTKAVFQPVSTRNDLPGVKLRDIMTHNELYNNEYGMFYHLHSARLHYSLWNKMQTISRFQEVNYQKLFDSTYS